MAVAKSDRQKGEYVLIIEDKGQKEGLHILKNRYFKSHDMEVLRAPLPVGDYIIATDKVADVIHRKSARKMELKRWIFLAHMMFPLTRKGHAGNCREYLWKSTSEIP